MIVQNSRFQHLPAFAHIAEIPHNRLNFPGFFKGRDKEDFLEIPLIITL